MKTPIYLRELRAMGACREGLEKCKGKDLFAALQSADIGYLSWLVQKMDWQRLIPGMAENESVHVYWTSRVRYWLMERHITIERWFHRHHKQRTKIVRLENKLAKLTRENVRRLENRLTKVRR